MTAQDHEHADADGREPVLRMTSRTRAIWLLCVPSLLGAQSVTGTVLDRTNKAAVPGALLALTAAQDGRIVARGLSDQNGRFLLRAGAAGTFSLSVKRIGVRPQTVAVAGLAENETRTLELLVDDIILPLDPVRVVAKSVCGRDAENAATTARLLEEVRAAASATLLSGRSSGSTTRFIRRIDASTEEVQSESVTVATGTYERPFYSVRAESLARHGFVRENANGTLTYFAPDAELLASEWFVEAHCFNAIAHPRDTTLIGLAIKPIPGQRHVDVEGVLWLDRQSAELRELDARYTGLPAGVRDDRVGAHVGFQRLTNGRWIVSDWVIRAPVIGVYETATIRVLGRIAKPSERVDSLLALSEEGGFVELGDRKSTASFGMITGTVRSSEGAHHGTVIVVLSGTRRVARADSTGRFVFDRVLPGRYAIRAVRNETGNDTGTLAIGRAVVTTDAPSSLELTLHDDPDAIRRSCAPGSLRDHPGVLLLYVIDTTSNLSLAGLDFLIRATRYDRVSESGARVLTTTTTGRTTLDGAVALCGRAAIGSLELEVGVAPNVIRMPIGLIRPDQPDVHFVMLAQRPLISSRAVVDALATGERRGTIAGLAGNVSQVELGADGPTSMPDACGRFLFAGVPAGRNEIRFRTTSGRTFVVEVAVQRSDTTYLHVEGARAGQDTSAILPLDAVTFAALPSTCLRQQIAQTADSTPTRARRGAAIVTGSVRAKESSAAIPEAEVVIEGAQRTVRTDAGGRFTLHDIPPGAYRLFVRKAGFEPVTGVVVLAAGDSLSVPVEMGNVMVSLDTVRVAMPGYTAPFMADFEKRRAREHGTFVTRDMIESMQGLALSSIVQRKAPRIRLVPIRGGGWAAANSIPSASLSMGGGTPYCLMAVWRDGHRAEQAGAPFDLSSIDPESVAGIEVYTDVAAIPLQFAGNDAPCGAIVLWSR